MYVRRNTYIAAAIRTAPHLEQNSQSFILGGIGVAGEAIEAFEVIDQTLIDKKKLVKELGDVSWYVALTCHVHDIRFEHLLLSTKDIYEKGLTREGWFGINQYESLLWHGKQLLYAAKQFSEYAKKAVFHNHGADTEQIQALLTGVMYRVQYVAALVDVPIEEVLNVNIEKLIARYPERFTTEASLNKDESKE